MSDISRINSSVNLNSTYGVSSSKKASEASAQETTAQVSNQNANQTTSYKNPDDVMNMLDQTSYKPNLSTTSNTNSSKSTLKVSDYVTSEQAARISASANACMNNLMAIENYGQQMGLSSGASKSLAVETVNSLMS